MRSFKHTQIPFPSVHTDLSVALNHPRIDVEIGAGQGLHAIRYAQKHPDRHLIAIERTHTRFAQLKRRHMEHPDLKNLFPVHADALSVFVHYLSDQSIEHIFLLYPNPYPKEKQANLRWYNMPFMQFLKKRMKVDGHLVLATNLKEYAEEAERKLVLDWHFHLHAKHLMGNGAPARTHFEKKYLERGQLCWNLVFVNTGTTVIMGK